MQDYELIEQYARTGSQEAFRELAMRNVDAVYAAARRQVRDPQLADDVTQAVFLVLSRKAKRLNARGSLVGWLMKTTHFACRDCLKKEARRRKHEQEAAAMKPTITPEFTAAQERFEPEIDRAMARLDDTDRGAIALRYLESRSIAEVGQALGISAEAAAKRIGRALERLRKILIGRDAMFAGLPLAALLEQLPHMAAPAAVAQAAAAGASSTVAAGISKGVIHLMLWQKAKAAAIVIASIFAAGAAGVGTVSLLQAQPNGRAAAPPTAVAARDGQSPIARLKNGVSVQIVGVSEFPSTNRTWWNADGSPMPAAPYHHAGSDVSPSAPRLRPGQQSSDREIAVRLNLKVEGQDEPASARWRTRIATGTWWGTAEDANNKVVPGISPIAACTAGGTDSLRVEIAATPWKTIVTAPAVSDTATSEAGKTFDLKKPFEQQGETHFIFSRTGIERGLDERFIAIDTSGKQHLVMLKSTRSRGNDQTDEFYVALSLASLKELKFQQRPFDQWVEIRNFSMESGRQAEVTVATSDDLPPPPPSLSYTGRLKNGISIELLGIAEYPSPGRNWWRADGSPLRNPPYQNISARIAADDPNVLIREVAIRVNQTPTDGGEEATVNWRLLGSRGSTSGGTIGGEPGVQGYAMIFSDTREGVNLRADIAGGAWEIVGRCPIVEEGSFADGATKYVVNRVWEDAGRTHVAFTRSPGLDIRDASRAIQVVAIDADGRETTAVRRSMSGTLASMQGELEISVPLSSLRELQLRQRTYNAWIEIRNISLYANELTPVKVITSEDPPAATNPAP